MSGQKIIPMVLLTALVYVLFVLHAVVFHFVLAAAIAYILNPLVAFLEIRGIRRRRAVLVVYLALICMAVGLTYLGCAAVVQSSTTIGADLPDYIQKARAFMDRNLGLVDRIPFLANVNAAAWLREHLDHESQRWLVSLAEQIPSSFGVHIVPLLEMVLLIPLLVFFFMLDGPAFLDHLLDLVPARYVEMTLNVIVEIDFAMGSYIRGILVQAFFMGVAAGIGYGLMGLNYTVYIAAWVALSSMIPLLGPISAALTGSIVALLQWGTLSSLLKVLVVYGLIRFVDECVLQPVIMRRAVHIHPLMLVFTLLAGAYLGGFWGLLFAVPAACMIKVLFRVGWEWYHTEYGTRSPAPGAAIQAPLI